MALLQARQQEAAPADFLAGTASKPQAPREQSEIRQEVDVAERRPRRSGLAGQASDDLRCGEHRERRREANRPPLPTSGSTYACASATERAAKQPDHAESSQRRTKHGHV